MTSDLTEIDGLLERMDARLETFEETDDNRRIFLTVYRTMTETIRQGLSAGMFVDDEWTDRLTTNFAEMYFAADDAYETEGAQCPGAWDCAFEAAMNDRVLVLEHALLGINAHIIYDLPRAVANTMREFGDHLPPGSEDVPPAGITARRRYDYEVVNFLLAQTIDTVQDLIADRFLPLVRVLDVLAGPLDEYLVEVLLRFARAQGWHFAVALAYAQSTGEEQCICNHLERVALDFVHRIDLIEMIPTDAARRVAHLFREPLVDPDEISIQARRRRRLSITR